MRNPIEAKELSRTFGDLVAVDGINLSVAKGEVFGFLGPNGAGKSTAVRMLTTLLKPTSGQAWVAGHNVMSSAGAVRKRIGVALQDAAIDPLMTGNELLKLQSVLHGIPKRKARARCGELLETVGLTAAGDRRVGTYSGGMRRRLDLALSLVHEPEVLFLDEPTTGLHFEDIRQLLTVLDQLVDNGNSVIIIEHNLDVIKTADHIIDIGPEGGDNGGQIIAKGTPEDIVKEKKSYTGAYLKPLLKPSSSKI